jgi:hypothetical protein
MRCPRPPFHEPSDIQGAETVFPFLQFWMDKGILWDDHGDTLDRSSVRKVLHDPIPPRLPATPLRTAGREPIRVGGSPNDALLLPNGEFGQPKRPTRLVLWPSSDNRRDSTLFFIRHSTRHYKLRDLSTLSWPGPHERSHSPLLTLTMQPPRQSQIPNPKSAICVVL